jgi:alanine dehydrogenase
MGDNNPYHIRLGSSGEYLPKEERVDTLWKKNSQSIGIPRETSANENRIALIPDAVKLLTSHGHRVVVEKNAGLNAHFTDHQYSEAGAELTDDTAAVYQCDIILKIAPPSEEEIRLCDKRRSLISILNMPLRSKEYFQLLMSQRITALSFEWIQDKSGGLPIKRSMSEIIGNASVMIAAEYLCHPEYGKGLMLGGFPGLAPTSVVIIGAGTVAEYAARTALGMGASVKIFDNSVYKLRNLQTLVHNRLYTSTLKPELIELALQTADVVIAAKHSPSGLASCLITSEMVSKMKEGSVIIDVSIDQGGCFETSKPTTHQYPVYRKSGVTHYCVPNIASKVPQTASTSLSNFFAPVLLEAGECGGLDNLLKINRPLSKGVYVYHGTLTNEQISKIHDLPFQHLELMLAAYF